MGPFIKCCSKEQHFIVRESKGGSYFMLSYSSAFTLARVNAQFRMTSMANAKQLILINMGEAFTKTADVLLVLDSGVAILCHSQVLSTHSTVLSNMFRDVGSQHDNKVRIPLTDFTEAQCSALLNYLYNCSVSSESAAFASHDAANHDAAAAVARFAHTYDAPHALLHVEAYLTGFMDERFKCKDSAGTTDAPYKETMLAWAVMADRFDMHQLCDHCERAMVMYWDSFQNKPDLVDQLSRGALQRIAKGLNMTLMAPIDGQWILNFIGSASQRGRAHNLADQLEEFQSSRRKYPDVRDFIAWRQQMQPTVQ